MEKNVGELQIYDNGNIQKILPEAQTVVFLKCDETEHEVLIANREKMSISGWLKRL